MRWLTVPDNQHLTPPPSTVRAHIATVVWQANTDVGLQLSTSVTTQNGTICCTGVQDISQLRKLAAVRGLVNTELRARLWPYLIGGHSSSSAVASAAAGSQTLSWHGVRSGLGGSKCIDAAGSVAGLNASDHDNSDKASEDQYLEWAAGVHKDSMTVRQLTGAHCCNSLMAVLHPLVFYLLSILSVSSRSPTSLSCYA